MMPFLFECKALKKQFGKTDNDSFILKEHDLCADHNEGFLGNWGVHSAPSLVTLLFWQFPPLVPLRDLEEGTLSRK